MSFIYMNPSYQCLAAGVTAEDVCCHRWRAALPCAPRPPRLSTTRLTGQVLLRVYQVLSRSTTTLTWHVKNPWLEWLLVKPNNCCSLYQIWLHSLLLPWTWTFPPVSLSHFQWLPLQASMKLRRSGPELRLIHKPPFLVTDNWTAPCELL